MSSVIGQRQDPSRLSLPQPRKSASAALDWSVEEASLALPLIGWPGCEARELELDALAREIYQDTHPVKDRRAALIEALIARGIVPDEWSQRVFRGCPKSAGRSKHLSIADPALIHHTAVSTLSTDLPRMLAAESIARVLFPTQQLLWAGATRVDVATFVKLSQRRAQRVAYVRAHGVCRWLRCSVRLCDLDSFQCYADAPQFVARLKLKYPEWAPLFALGVFPWECAYDKASRVVLMCPETARGVQLWWVSRRHPMDFQPR